MNELVRLQRIFREFFDDESLELTRSTSPGDIEAWDSLAHVNIVVMCEAEFGIKFDMDDVVNIKNAGDILDAIERYK